jgi:hypothetical protein
MVEPFGFRLSMLGAMITGTMNRSLSGARALFGPRAW